MTRHLVFTYWMAPLFVVGMLGLTGCANYLAPFETERAHPGIESEAHDRFDELPPPQDKVVAAVYRFRDQTGQYKEAEQGASWSTAVTQGATSILIRSLEESGWFTPIEREGLSNLMNERQIVQQIRSQYEGEDGQRLGPLPPLLYAGVMLEGGIIGYDSNVMTGGAGVGYFGLTGSGTFRQDQVTIYLRAVSTQNGRVLKTVHTTKTIISEQLDAGLFRFITPNRLIEAEAGFSHNEPRVVAVTEAIDEAVKNLIIEGVEDDLWSLADPDAASAAVFTEHDDAAEAAARRDFFARLQQPNRSGLGIGSTAGALRYQGNYKNPLARPGGEVHVRRNLTPRFAVGLSGGAGMLAADRAFDYAHINAELQAHYYVLPDSRVTPFLTAGAGLLGQEGKFGPVGEHLFPYAAAGGGLELMATPQLGLNVSLRNNYALVDGLDGIDMGRFHDSFWSLQAGFTYYLRWF